MHATKKEQQLIEALEAAAAAHGFELVDLERSGSGRAALLRVYIDKPEGLNLDDVAAATAWISEVVEAGDPYKGSYTLEVSSPGIDRPLRTWAHFERALGEEAVITLDGNTAPTEATGSTKPRLKYTGIIAGVDAQKQIILLEAEGVQHGLKFEYIKKAKIKGHIDFSERKDS